MHALAGTRNCGRFLLAESAIPAELIEAYRVTLFRVDDGEDSFVLRIGRHSPELEALYARFHVDTACYLTAWNGFSERQSGNDNNAAQNALTSDLHALGVAVLRGHGDDPEGLWAPEPSLLALGLTRAMAGQLGVMYHQNAVVWCGPEAVPELLLLR